MSTEEKSLNFIEQIIEEDLKNGLSQDKLRFRFRLSRMDIYTLVMRVLFV